LENNRVTAPSGYELAFRLPEFRRQGLLQGVDEIGLTLSRMSEIDTFHERVKRERPWAFPATLPTVAPR